MALGSIVIDMLLRTGAFNNDAKLAERRLADMGKRARETGRVIGTALAGALTATGAAAVAMTRELVTTADQVQRLSRLSGTTTDTFQRWAAGANTVGIEQDKLADIFKDMQDRVGDFIQTGGGPMADFFERVAPRVGLTADAFARLSGPEALQLFVDSLEKAGASANEMVFYMEAIASDSTLLLPLLQNNGKAMRDLGDMAQRYGAILDKDAIAASREMKRQMDELSMIATGLRTEMAVNLLPTFQEFAELLKDDGFRSGFESIIRGALEATAAFARLAVTTANVTKFLAESAAAAVAGPSADDLVRVQDRINRIKETMDAIRKGGTNPVWMSGNLTAIGLPNDRAIELLEAYTLGRSGSVLRILNEELLKEENKLEFGVKIAEDAAAEASRLAQEAADKIQTPTIGLGIGPKSEGGEASTNSRDEWMAALNQQYGELLANQEREIVLYGEIGRAAALSYDMANGALSNLQQTQKNALMEQAEWLDFMDEVSAIEDMWATVKAEVDTATGEISVFAEQAGRNIQSFIGDGLYQALDGNFKSIADSFSEMIKRMLAEAAAAKILEAFSGWATGYSGAGAGFINGLGGALGKASGGYISGPGTGTSDSIPAYLSNGEYVINASAVKKYGAAFFDGLNAKRFAGGGAVGIIPNNRIGGLASGGNVKVEVINNGQPMQAQASSEQMPDGTQLIRLVLNAVGDSIASGTGAPYAAVKNRFGLRDAV